MVAALAVVVGGGEQTIPGAVLIEPSLCPVTAVYRGEEAQE